MFFSHSFDKFFLYSPITRIKFIRSYLKVNDGKLGKLKDVGTPDMPYLEDIAVELYVAFAEKEFTASASGMKQVIHSLRTELWPDQVALGFPESPTIVSGVADSQWTPISEVMFRSKCARRETFSSAQTHCRGF